MRDNRCALYATSPERAIVGLACVVRIETGNPRSFWPSAEHRAGIRFDEFQEYFKGAHEAVGLCLGEVVRLENPFTLNEMRQRWTGFHPPQGFSYLDSEQVADVVARLKNAQWGGRLAS